jgi:hypothetical protein
MLKSSKKAPKHKPEKSQKIQKKKNFPKENFIQRNEQSKETDPQKIH